jgi:hypothetical protein
MKQAATKRQPASTDGVIAHRPHAPATSEPTAPPATTPAASGTETGRLSWGWRLALFIWSTSFVFLFLYEILVNMFLSRK